jgi:hypothetical protein
MRPSRELDILGRMNATKNTLDKIPSIEELEIIYFDLDCRARRGETLPLYRLTVMLQDNSQFTGVIIEPKQRDESRQIVLRLDTPAQELAIFSRCQINSVILKDIQESGHYFFETWKPEGPYPSLLELRTKAREIEQSLAKSLGASLSIRLPSLPALKASQLGAMSQCLVDLGWVIHDMSRTEAVKEELRSRIAGIEFKTLEECDASARLGFAGGILAMESPWQFGFASAKSRAVLWEMLEALF